MTDTMPPERNARHKILRAMPWVVKLLISSALLWYLLRTVNLAEAVERAKALSATHIVGAFILVCAQVVLGGLRWKFVLSAIGARLTMAKSVSITFVSLFFNQFLPASVGADLVRVWQSSRAGLLLTTAVTSVMLERFGNLLCVVAMALAVLPFWGRHVQSDSTRDVFILIGMAGVVALAMLMFLDRLPYAWRRWRIVRGIASLARDTRSLFLHLVWASLLIVTAVAAQVMLAAAVHLVALGLGLDIKFIDCLVLMPPVVLVSALPISVAGWGVRELAMVTAFGMLSVPPDSALALSIVMALTATAVSLPGGVIWLWSRSEPSANAPGQTTKTPP